MKIRHLKHKDIDKQQWDDAIMRAANPLIYGLSWYLDVVSPEWEALITDEYKYILPIPAKSKFGLKYIVQPQLTQHFNIFSEQEITASIAQKFIKKIPYLSYQMALELPSVKAIKSTVRPNYILDLQKDYEHIRNGYTKNTARNVKKATNFKLKVTSNKNIEEFLQAYQDIDRNFQANTIDFMQKFLETGIDRGFFKLFAVENANEENIAWACVLFFKERLTYLIPFSNQEGFKKSAMFFLIDYLIKEYAGKAKELDFEGSAIEGIARFYRGFGAKQQSYHIIKRLRPSFLIGRF